MFELAFGMARAPARPERPATPTGPLDGVRPVDRALECDIGPRFRVRAPPVDLTTWEVTWGAQGRCRPPPSCQWRRGGWSSTRLRTLSRGAHKGVSGIENLWLQTLVPRRSEALCGILCWVLLCVGDTRAVLKAVLAGASAPRS